MTRDSGSEVSPNVVVSSNFFKHEIALTESELRRQPRPLSEPIAELDESMRSMVKTLGSRLQQMSCSLEGLHTWIDAKPPIHSSTLNSYREVG
jgi:hypothetical protein